MERLREIMGDLTDIQYSLEAFSMLLKDLDEVYDIRREDEKKENVWLFKIIVDSIQKDLDDKIAEIDQFILDYKKR